MPIQPGFHWWQKIVRRLDWKRSGAAFFLLMLSARFCVADTNSPLPFVSPIFGDNMVLQRGKANTIWGWSQPGDIVRVEIAGHKASGVAGRDGRWEAKIDPPPAGGPYTVWIDGAQHVELHEVLVGDVWLCGGQSNMQLGLARTRNGAEEIASANHPEIRIYIVHDHVSYSPTAAPQGKWRICGPKALEEDGGFSAVAYYFGRKVQQDIHVPIGLIQDCLGGTTAEAWTSPETVRKLGGFEKEMSEVQRLKNRGGPEYGNYIMHWYDDYDLGIKGSWEAPELDDAAWKPTQVPGDFHEIGAETGPNVVWLRKEVMLPDPIPAGRASIHLGVVDRMETTYVNGQWVGASAWVENPRVYGVKEGILKPGRNVIAVRVFKSKAKGGFMSDAATLELELGNGAKVALAGEWKGALSVDARPPHTMPLTFENWPVMPSVLYQGMLAPVAPLALTGAIWYQGEANAERAFQYRSLLPALIGDWRKVFGQGDFPFYVVSLPAFMHRQSEPTEAAWAEMREAQAIAVHRTPQTALAVTVDTGDPDNIHPPDKKIVGERLAACALAQHYGEKIVYEGPTCKGVEKMPGALKLRFAHAEGGLVNKGDKIGEFSVAGKDRKWFWADARIEGETVVVTAPGCPEPVAARYAWQSNPEATLYNGAGFPAVPFRTDDWPEIAEAKK
ncbi:MAG TPA: sialate O-acetylesterase [Verrucomicrobiae bacterium]|jgi:sialate O-acetylesterase|nr:sialate O-acetylesterase [Verrucomicrobiae bacterium]